MQSEDFEQRYTDEECEDLFAFLFPNGFSGEDVLAEIAPEGWERSTLHFVFHPTVDQVHWESVQLHRNLRQWPRRPVEVQPEPEPTLEEIRSAYQDAPLDEKRELRELVGMCLREVFSNGNKVTSRKRRLVDLGSWRGCAGFLAEQLNLQCGLSQYSYMDFYMERSGCPNGRI